MKSKCRFFCMFLLVCIFFAISGGECNAEQFTFNVPIEIKNLQNVEGGKVSCSVRNAQGVIIPATSMNDAAFPIVGGNYNGVAKVSLSVQNPWTAKQYSCYLSVKTVGNAGYHVIDYTLKDTIGLVSASPTPGAALLGNLPQQ